MIGTDGSEMKEGMNLHYREVYISEYLTILLICHCVYFYVDLPDVACWRICDYYSNGSC